MEATLKTNKNSIDIPSDFKSTLPPRKRAKTKEEKEQRRIERILRNRKAAHQSREKKRLHLKFLEDKFRIMEQIMDGLDLTQLFSKQNDKLKLVSELNNLAMEDPCTTTSTDVKEEQNNEPSFDFTFSMKDVHSTTGSSNSVQLQVPSPSTSISTQESISMSPEMLANTLKNEIMSTSHIKQEEEEEDNHSIMDNNDANTFALHLQDETNEETIKHIFNTTNSVEDESNQDFDFEADAATALENSIMSQITEDSQNNLLLTTSTAESHVLDIVNDFDQAANNNSIAGSFDLDNWRNPAAITLIS
ncbi:hypothetical protein C6P45_000270 [Maudiozyma exigua]|uniref:BZIP domain-containing protein n=1 Tax=Maudiozyma exigua TaxID=34358 RepID=A0A9P6W7M4_MAUEX|nr:hypothetical protein C6P45_000270 [Kazachstania exigua]